MAAVRLENVLKRAEELEAMQKAPAALDVLYETVLSKRTRAMPLDQLEPVFAKFVRLAVQLRRGKVVKDGLHQYKKLVLSSGDGDNGVKALVSAVDLLLELAGKAVDSAQQQAREVKIEAEDLDEESPQDLLLAMVSSDEAQDRTDREVVTPWLKFLWESFRGVLDVLRNNSRLEGCYATAASRAFEFCLSYERKTEFRRLCELLRTHLQYAATQSRAYHKEVASARQRAIEQAETPDVTPEQIARQLPPNVPQNPIDLSDADTLQRFLDTRFEQLDVAVKLELWQEAFRSVEDVHTLLTATRRPIPVASMATYYETLARVFAVSQNHLFHAATYLRYFAMLVSRRAPESELRRVAGLTVLGLLCVPRNSGAANVVPTGRARRWMALINLARCPTRQTLIDVALSRNVLAYAAPELRFLFDLLERAFNPLTLREKMADIAPVLSQPEFSNYSQPLLEVAATAVFDELATTYSEARLEFVLGLVSFPKPLDASPRELERLLVRGSAQGYRVRIDHQKGVVRFVDSLAYPLGGTAGAQVRSELYEFAKRLAGVSTGIMAVSSGTSITTVEAEDPEAAILRRAALLAENREFLSRQGRELERKRAQHEEKLRTDEEALRERARAQHEEKLRAEQRAAHEEAERQKAQFAKQMAEAELAEKRKLAESINAKGHVHVDLDKLEELSKDQLNKMQIDQLDQEAKSLTSRMAAVARRYDHLERALRREEARLWQEDASAQRKRDEEQHDRRAEALRAGARRSHELAVAYSSRLSRVRSDYSAFTREYQARHDSKVAELRATNAKLLNDAKQKRAAEIEERRRAEQEREAEEERKAELRRKQEEERRKQEEERSKTVYRRPETLRSTSTIPTASPINKPPSAIKPTTNPFGAAAGKPAANPYGAAAGKPAASPFGAAAGKPAASPFGAAAGKPAASPFGAAAGKPAASPFGAAAGKPAANPYGAAAGKPTANPFGAAAGKPAANPYGAAAGKPAANPFGAAAGKPANISTPSGAYRSPSVLEKPSLKSEKPKEENSPKPNVYLPRHRR